MLNLQQKTNLNKTSLQSLDHMIQLRYSERGIQDLYTILPGTTIQSKLETFDVAEQILGTIFSGGGLILSQVSQMTSLEPYIIQNWVKRGFLSPPIAKRYSKNQFCRIVIINMLKETLQLDKITNMLTYINGVLDDESDDVISDTDLYNYYVNLVVLIYQENGDLKYIDEKNLSGTINELLVDYREPYKGVKGKLKKVLKIMFTAHLSSILNVRVNLMLGELDI